MSEHEQAKMRAITISRQYGSGGGEIAARLAQRLKWHLFDHEAVVQVARQLDISPEEAEERDEHVESLGVRILESFASIQPTMAATMMTPPRSVDVQTYHQALCRILEHVIEDGQAVIVGRGAQMALSSRRDVLHIRVVASLEQRITYVTRREGLNREEAKARIQEKDAGRERYLQAVYRQHPSDPMLYDLVLNTSVINLNRAVDLITLALESKAEQQDMLAERLGPGAEMTPYQEQPQDFAMPVDGGKT